MAVGLDTATTTSRSVADSTDAKTAPIHDQLTLTTTTTEARIDSRLLAKQLDNKHRHVMALLDKYLDVFKKHGHVSFKNADGERRQGGGKAERYALLNENQAYFLLNLSRNTEIVVALKSRLITAFSEARKAADMRRTEYLPGYHALHDGIHALAAGSPNERFIHMNVNKLMNTLAGIGPGQRAEASLPTQSLLVVGQMMAAHAMRAAPDAREGYKLAKAAVEPLLALTAGNVPQATI